MDDRERCQLNKDKSKSGEIIISRSKERLVDDFQNNQKQSTGLTNKTKHNKKETKCIKDGKVVASVYQSLSGKVLGTKTETEMDDMKTESRLPPPPPPARRTTSSSQV